MSKKLFPLEGEENFFAHPVKKAAAQILLQSPQRVADGGLSQRKFPSSNCKTAMFSEGNEGPELSAIYRIVHV